MPPKADYTSLHRKMVAAILLAACTPLFLVSGLLLHQFSRSYREKLHAHLGELVQKHRQDIDGFLTEQLNILRHVATSSSIEELQDEAFLQVQLSHMQQQFSGVFEDLGLIDDTGRQVAYTGPFLLLKADYSEADWYKNAITRQSVVSDVFLGLRGRPHFIVALRLPRGEHYWILRATIDFRTFNTLVENLRIGKTGMAYILNRNGEFQTRPTESSPFQRSLYKALVTDAALKEPGVSIIRETEDSGKPVLFVGALLKDGDWLLIYQQNLTDAYEDLRFAKKTAWLLVLLGCIGIIGTSWVISRRFVAHITAADTNVTLMNRQVVESGKLAAIGELAAGIAHEINNPVAIMMEKAGWMQDLLEEEDVKNSKIFDEFHQSLDEIKLQARRCKDITHNLLNFAREPDAGPLPVQMNTLLSDIITLSRHRAKFSGVEFQMAFEEDLPEIDASPAELQQVFLNLINNALDAMEKTGGRIDIRTATDDGDILVAVSDSGTGIPESDLGRIFDPFFTTKPPGKGTGLGLSICYGIIDRMGGRIEVISHMGKGTTFNIRIPVRYDGEPESFVSP